MNYPFEPGVRRNSTGDTAEGGRKRIAPYAPSLEVACLSFAEARPITADEAHERLERELGRRLPIYSVRPRFSALKAKGLVKDSGLRRAPPGGCPAVVWMVTTAEERAIFLARRAAAPEHGEGAE
jgi:hypothetical protein